MPQLPVKLAFPTAHASAHSADKLKNSYADTLMAITGSRSQLSCPSDACDASTQDAMGDGSPSSHHVMSSSATAVRASKEDVAAVRLSAAPDRHSTHDARVAAAPASPPQTHIAASKAAEDVEGPAPLLQSPAGNHGSEEDSVSSGSAEPDASQGQPEGTPQPARAMTADPHQTVCQQMITQAQAPDAPADAAASVSSAPCAGSATAAPGTSCPAAAEVRGQLAEDMAASGAAPVIKEAGMKPSQVQPSEKTHPAGSAQETCIGQTPVPQAAGARERLKGSSNHCSGSGTSTAECVAARQRAHAVTNAAAAGENVPPIAPAGSQVCATLELH